MKFYVECFTDKYFLRIILKQLGYSQRTVIDAGNKDQVIKSVEKDNVAFGVIDEDPMSYPRKILQAKYKVREQVEGLQLLQHNESTTKQIVIIVPRIEEWFLKRAEINRVNIHQFDLKASNLHDLRIDKNKSYQNFIDQLASVDKGCGVLKSWVENFVNNVKKTNH